VYRSIDSGASWVAASSGIVQSEVNSMAGNSPDIYAVMGYDSLYSSSDNGITWTADTSFHSGAICLGDSDRSKSLCIDKYGNLCFVGSRQTWNTINGGVLNTTYPTMLVQSGSNLISATQESGEVFLSSDNGTTWKNVGRNTYAQLASLTASGSSVVAGTRDGVYASTDKW